MRPGARVFMFVFGLSGVVFCGLKVRSAWQGKAGVPIGTIIGGALFGVLGAGVGNAIAGNNDRYRTKPNIGGVIFWSFCCLVWVAIMTGSLFAE